jgi:hypothetical protein
MKKLALLCWFVCSAGLALGQVTNYSNISDVAPPFAIQSPVSGQCLVYNSLLQVTNSSCSGGGGGGGVTSIDFTSSTLSITGTNPVTTSGTVDLEIDTITDALTSLANKPSVGVVATSNLTLSGAQTIDSVAGTAGTTLVLATAQSTASQNGPWLMQTGAWTRPAWYPSGGTTQAFQFVAVRVRLGTQYADSLWDITTSGAITIDTTATTWAIKPTAINSVTTTGLAAVATSGLASDLSGTLGAAQIPTPTSSSLGGVKSISVVSHEWLASLGTNGSFTQSQPSCADLSNAAPSCSTDTTNASNITSGTLSVPVSGAAVHATALTCQPTSAPTRDAGNVGCVLAQGGPPLIMQPSFFMAANGQFVLGQAPSSSATATFGATSGSTTVTFSAATLLGTASDVGRVVTILDTGVYKYFTITAQSSTTVATGTISGGTLSTTGAWANSALWLSGMAQSLGNTVSFAAVLPTVYAKCFMWFIANSINGSNTAGWYPVTMASTTQGQVFNNTPYSSGTPVFPASPTAFVSSAQGAITQTTASITAITDSLPGNALGANGGFEIDIGTSQNNSANAKTIGLSYGSASITGINPTTQTYTDYVSRVRNAAGTTNSQIAFGPRTNPSASTVADGAPTRIAVDSTVSQNITTTLQLANAFDYMVQETFSIKVFPN